MNTRYTLLTLIVLSALVTTAPIASAQETGPSPFGTMLSGLNPANWKMPQFKNPLPNILPNKSEKDRVITKKNGLVQEVSNTAKQSWQRTKDTLNPMRLIPAGFKQNQTAQPAAPKREGGFFSRLLSPPSEPATDKKSVTDWLKQDPVR